MTKVLVLGGDGYCGWPTSLYLSAQGYDVTIADNFSRRLIDTGLLSNSLVPIKEIPERLAAWNDNEFGMPIKFRFVNLGSINQTTLIIEKTKPDVIVHFAEQRSAPYSMIDYDHAYRTMKNNVLGTLNLLFAMHEIVPDAHLVKLGTMGEYGTPNIPITEGFIDIEHKGRKDRLPFPKQPGSWYHLTKVHDSNNIMFACKIWGLKATDLNQGVVYGQSTPQCQLHPDLVNRWDYDQWYGTVLNRLCVQAALDHPLTVYGEGGQTRGFINIMDTIQCIKLAIEHPPENGEFRVVNQMTEQFSVKDLALGVQAVNWDIFDREVEIHNIPNPRLEKEQHFYEVEHTKLEEWGLQPNLLGANEIADMIETAYQYKHLVNRDLIMPTVQWQK